MEDRFFYSWVALEGDPISPSEHVSSVVLHTLGIPSSFSPLTQTDLVSHVHKPPVKYVFFCRLKTLKQNDESETLVDSTMEMIPSVVEEVGELYKTFNF